MGADKGRGRHRRSSNKASKVSAMLFSLWNTIGKYQQEYINKQLLMSFIFNPAYTWMVATLLLLGDVFVSIFIIETVKCKIMYIFILYV